MATKQVKPITSKEANLKRLESFDPDMITAVNNLLTKKLDASGYADILQKDIVAEYFRVKGIEPTKELKDKMYGEHQLDFEGVFRKAGWNVSYDKPGYNEDYYEASFKFKKKS